MSLLEQTALALQKRPDSSISINLLTQPQSTYTERFLSSFIAFISILRLPIT